MYIGPVGDEVRRLAWVLSLLVTSCMVRAAAAQAPPQAPSAGEIRIEGTSTPSGEAVDNPAPPPPATTTSTVKAAARLALVGRTREHQIYIDKPTLRKLTGDKFELWAEVHSDGGERVKFLMQLNCGDRSYLVKSEVGYDDAGEVIENKTHRAPALQYVVPDSTSEFIHEAVCRPS
jgi:hypothetical protein